MKCNNCNKTAVKLSSSLLEFIFINYYDDGEDNYFGDDSDDNYH